MRNSLLLVVGAAIALAGCSAEPTRSGSTAAPGLLVASAAPLRGNAAHASDRIDLDPIVRLPGFACARTGDAAFHCTRE